jgi:hypothetical protein
MYIYTLLEAILPPTCKGKGKAIPLQAWTGPDCSSRLRLPEILTFSTRNLSAVRNGRLYPQEMIVILIYDAGPSGCLL